MKAIICFQISILFLTLHFSNAQNSSRSDLDDFIVTVMHQNDIPGLSIAVIFNDSVIYLKGFGIKKTGESDPVDAHTLYEVVSLTKSFTATIIGMLVEQGKIQWTDPVVKYIPGFKTSEPFVTQSLTIQDLLTLRSGLLNGDTLHAMNRQDLIPKIKDLKISDKYRIDQSSFNLNYTLAAIIAEKIEGRTWEEMVRNRIFSRLEMNETYTDLSSAMAACKNVTTPHTVKNGKVIPVERVASGIYNPAEGMYSNIIDLAKWANLQLNKGACAETSILRPETVETIQQPHTVAMEIFRNYFNPDAHFMTIGLGWFISDYKGYKLIQMGGLSYGTTNLISLIPSKKMGIIIQSNKGLVFDSFVKINYKIFNELLLE